MNFLDVFYMPLRKRVAAARFEEAKLRVAGMVLDLAAEVRAAFYVHESNEQMLELRRTIVQALTASFEVARRLHEAGNITDLELARERALMEGAKLQLRSAEVAARQSREQLNTLMGLWGGDVEWEMDKRLPDIPAQPVSVERLESRALRQSIDLAHARQRIVVAGEQVGFSKATALIPELHSGPLGEREEGAWEVGPVLEFPIPLFDQGQARIGRGVAELRRAQHEYYSLAVRIRSTARSLRERMLGARDRALYYRDIMLPLQERIVNDSQLQYNAMQLGPIHLLRVREQQIETGVAYIEALRDYWLARGDVGQILSGRLPAGTNGLPTGGASAPKRMNGAGEGH
jgi:cobalt-zinc-cadmium efflux system outer membrane protein